jgi:hypothetical protein
VIRISVCAVALQQNPVSFVRWADEGRVMMLRVIDTIEHRQSWTHRYPDVVAKGEGLLVVLESESTKSDAFLVGTPVSVRRPDGSTIALVVGGVERGAGGVPGLFFRGLTSRDVPRGSTIEGS